MLHSAQVSGPEGTEAHSPGQGLQSLLLLGPGPWHWLPCPSPRGGPLAPAWGGRRAHGGQPLGSSLPSPPAQDTLRDCTHDERSCLSSLQFVSPLYFVSFVLTAQFVLINVVVAVLMKHLDDSNKEAQEDAEMDAELELEMAQGLGPGPRPPAGSPGALGRGPGGSGGGGDSEGRLCRSCYSPAQVGRGWGRRGGISGLQGRCPRWLWAETSAQRCVTL